MTPRTPEPSFSLAFYLDTLRAVVIRPGDFFESLPRPPGFANPFAFLLVSSVLHTALSAIFVPSILWVMVIFVNALLSPMIALSAAYGIIRFVLGLRLAFGEIFALYAYAIGTTHLISWIPMANWISEPWWWILVGTGMTRRFRMRGFQAAGAILLSIFLIRLVLAFVSPLLLELKKGVMG